MPQNYHWKLTNQSNLTHLTEMAASAEESLKSFGVKLGKSLERCQEPNQYVLEQHKIPTHFTEGPMDSWHVRYGDSDNAG